MTIFDKTMRLLQRSLDLRSARQRVISSNLANEETPGYRASELNFMDQLHSAHKGQLPVVLAATQPRHFGLRGPQGVQTVTGKLCESRARNGQALRERHAVQRGSDHPDQEVSRIIECDSRRAMTVIVHGY